MFYLYTQFIVIKLTISLFYDIMEENKLSSKIISLEDIKLILYKMYKAKNAIVILSWVYEQLTVTPIIRVIP